MSGNPEEMSIEETMAESLKEIRAKSEEKEEPVVESQEESTEEVKEREIGVKSDVKETQEHEETKESEEEIGVKEDVKEEVKAVEGEVVRPPASWTAKAKATFYDLPDHIQKEVVKRESDFHKGIANYKESAEFGSRVKRAVQPYEQILASKGVAPEVVVSQMLDASYRLHQGTQQQKLEFIAQIARDAGVDLTRLLNNEEEAYQEPVNPYVQQLEQRLAQIEGFTQQQAQFAQQQTAQQAQSSIEQFRNQVGQDGRPEHPFFDDVRADMANLVEISSMQGRQLGLKEAYEQAVWARADTREAMLQLQQKQQFAKQKADEAQKTAQAKKLASVNVKSTSAVKTVEAQEPVGTVEETIRETLKKIKTRSN